MLSGILFTAGLTLAACSNDSNTNGKQPDNGNDEYAELFDTANGFPAALSNSWKIWNHRNALITQGFGADPTVMVYEDRAYVFSSNDSLMYGDDGKAIQMTYAGGIQGIRAISSSDLANWTDHGIINVGNTPPSTNPIDPYGQRVTSYDTRSWAPSAAWKMINGSPKFFIYFANSGDGIGVITANSPTGPWTSPLPKLLIDRNTPNCSSVEYLFDPGVMVDDDGQGYMFFGGGNSDGMARRVKLGADMISLDGDPETWAVPDLFEDNEIAKINGTYYYSFCNRSSSSIAYMTSDEPFGTYSASRQIMRSPQVQLGTPDQNNHHCIFQFKGETYIAYHASKVAPAMGITTRYRSTLINKVSINSAGVISTINMTRSGVAQKGYFDPYVLNEAETIGIMGGVYTRADSGAGNGMVVTSIDSGDWIALYGVDFGGTGAKKFKATVRMPDSPADYVGAVELRLDPKGDGETSQTGNLTAANTASIKDGEVIGRVKFEAKPGEAGQYVTATINLYRTVKDVHDLVFVFYSSLGAHPETVNPDSRHKNGFEFDRWQFLQ